MKKLSIIVFSVLLAGTVNAQEPEALSATCSVDLTEVNINESVVWSANVSGGVAPYAYGWSGDVSGTSDSVTTSYDAVGLKQGSLIVTDAEEQNVLVDCDNSVIVSAPEPLEFNSCSALPTEAYIGDSVEWIVDISGGVAPYTYAITGDDGFSGDQSNRTITYNTVGTKNASIEIITDARDENIFGPFNCEPATVYEAVSVMEVSCLVSDENITEGDTVTFSTNVNGGSEPYSYYWEGDITSTTTESFDLTFDSEGTYDAMVTVNDNVDQSLTVSCPDITVEVKQEENNTSSGGGSSSGGRRRNNTDDNSTSTTTTTTTEATTTVGTTNPVVTTTTGSVAGVVTTNTVVDNGGESTTTDEVSTSTDEVIEENNSGLLAGLFSLDLSFSSIWLWLIIIILILLMIALIYSLNRKEDK